MREKKTFRDNLEDILAFTGGARLLTVTQAAEYLGRSRKWVRDHLNVTGRDGVGAVNLARWLSE